MEKRAFKYLYLAIIFFIGLSLGSVRLNASNKIQDEVDEFEEEIQTPGNDYEPNESEIYYVEENFFTVMAKDGEKFISKTIEFVIESGENILEVVLGV